MAARKLMPPMLKCRNCQLSTLSTFAALGGVSLPRVSHLPEARSLRLAPRKNQRKFSDQHVEQPESSPEQLRSAEALVDYRPAEGLTSEATASLPWYLKVQKPEQNQTPFPERQRLPELPSDGPPTLLPILEHLSNEIGLDYLTLLDLRQLNPPPALGSDLIMVFGTARSEKHLHVSADRFARWLRTEYKLRPYADGLLGRNELKLKMRRKNKRVKLLSSVGGATREDADDGIRTSWVCVNVGAIDGEKPARIRPRDDSFIGFGGQPDGVKLVVQMMTEERREELDLETLWGGYLARQERKAARDLDISIAEGLDVEVGSQPPHSKTRADPSSQPSSSRTTSEPQMPHHNRGFHTSARRPHVISALHQPLAGASQPGGDTSPMPAKARAAETPDAEELRTLLDSQAQRNGLTGPADLLTYLRALPRADATNALGNGIHDHDSTELLRNFYKHMPIFPGSEHWSLRISLVTFGVDLEHPGFTKQGLIDVFQEMQLAGVEIPHSVYEQVVCSLLRTSGDAPVEDFHISSAVTTLEDMSARCLFPLSRRISKAFFLALTKGEASAERQSASESLSRLLPGYPVDLEEQDHVDILQALAQAHHWRAFWSHWASLTLRGQRRSELQYTSMFRIVAAANDRRQCFRALGTHLPEADIEEPPVLLRGHLSQAVLQCLQVVEPSIEDLVFHHETKSQWSDLWRKCVAAAESEGH